MNLLDTLGWTPPRTFDGFRIKRRLGSGGMGDIYLGRDLALERDVALKFIAGPDPQREQKSRLLIEARAIARLQHANVVGVYRVGEVAGRPYIAYELVEGKSLDQAPRPMPWRRALQVGMGIARGLSAVHRRDVVHRDIKPANVMLTPSGDVKLLDFGIAKLLDAPAPRASAPGPGGNLVPRPTGPADSAALTARGTIVGTPLYLAPEVWLGQPATAQSDLYALGLVLYELLSGHLPLSGVPSTALASIVTTRDLPGLASACPDAPSGLADIVDRCIARDPAARYASADQLLRAFEALHAIYEPFSSAPVQRDADAALLARSFQRLAGRAESFASAVYQRLFARHPELRPLFPSDLFEQRKKLLGALQISVDHLEDFQRLVPLLEDLGRRHAAYGVKASDFDAVGEALLGALAELEGTAFSPEVERAWARAYAALAGAMQRGLADSRPTPPAHPFARVAYERELVLEPPRTRYTRAGDASIAYQSCGEGPVDLVLVMGWVTHLEVSWQFPSLARFLRGLAACSRLLTFDKRGTGLSDRSAVLLTPEQRTVDIQAVLDAAGVSRAILFGVSDGAALATQFAAQHPDRVQGLILYGGSPCMTARPDYPQGLDPQLIEHVIASVERDWGAPLFLDIQAPSMAGDEAFRRAWSSYLRMGAAPGAASLLMRMAAATDIRHLLPKVRAPALVLHREHDACMPLSGGRDLAAGIKGAELAILDGADHMPYAGDVETLLDRIRRFIASQAPGKVSSSARLLETNRAWP